MSGGRRYARGVEYLELAPAAELRPFVEAFWRFRVDDTPGTRTHVVPLTGGAMLTIAPRAGQAWLFGSRVEPLHKGVHPRDEFWGVHFWPGAAAALMRAVRRGGALEVTSVIGARLARLRGADPLAPDCGYRFQSYLADGRSTDARGELVNGAFVWTLEHPQAGRIRYTIRVTDQTWHEIGELSRDGQTWNQMFEMKLTRKR